MDEILMMLNLVRFRVENYIVRPQLAFIKLKSMEFTMPSLFKSAVASAVNHALAMMLQSSVFTVPSRLRSPTKVVGGVPPTLTEASAKLPIAGVPEVESEKISKSSQ